MTVYRSVAEQWELSFPRDALAEHIRTLNERTGRMAGK